jgi:hypothetical protein
MVKKTVASLIFTIATAPFSANAQDSDPAILKNCITLAELLNKSSKVNINVNDITPLYTWRASCAEKPPTGKGNVMALCEGTSIRSDGTAKLLFFWSKTNKGKLTTGYYSCRAATN